MLAPTRSALTAGCLTRETLAGLAAAQEKRPTAFLLVPEGSAASSTTARSLAGEPLPQVGRLGGGWGL